jgi:hypothetical protein
MGYCLNTPRAKRVLGMSVGSLLRTDLKLCLITKIKIFCHVTLGPLVNSYHCFKKHTVHFFSA